MTLQERAKAALNWINSFDDTVVSWEHKDTIRSCLEQAATGRWQTIETAPKKKTRITAWDGNRIETIEWGENWCSHGCYVPTHWMPLPAPPTDTGDTK